MELEKLHNKHPDLASAISVVKELSVRKKAVDGELAAEKWFADEMDQQPEVLVKKYGGVDKYLEVFESNRQK